MRRKNQEKKPRKVTILIAESALASAKLREPFLRSGQVDQFVNTLTTAHKAYLAENLGRQIKKNLEIRRAINVPRKRVSVQTVLKVLPSVK